MNYKPTKPLKAEEEENLLRLAKTKNKKAIDKLLNANYMFICKLAHKYAFFSARKIEAQDLVQEGSMGFVKAIDKFHVNRIGTVKFITYAQFWVKEYMRHFIRSSLNKDRNFKYKIKIYNESTLSAGRDGATNILNDIIEKNNLDFSTPESLLIQAEDAAALTYFIKDFKSKSKPMEVDIVNAVQEEVHLSSVARLYKVSRQRVDQRRKVMYDRFKEAMAYDKE